MPPLHIKLALVKQFLKNLNQESTAFKFLPRCFSELSEKMYLCNYRAENNSWYKIWKEFLMIWDAECR